MTATNAATITVNSPADNVVVDGSCTLREAIIAANTNTTTGDCTAGSVGADKIVFSIGSGQRTINLTSALPAITDQVTIDGTTQPGYAGSPILELNGASAGASAVGLTLTANGNTIRGLVINGFSFAGIDVLSANNTISGNSIGMNIAGTATLPNGDGILITGFAATGNTIGGTTTAARNLIAGNNGAGVHVNGWAYRNSIQGNQIGLFVNGFPTGNQQGGVLIDGDAYDNLVGASVSGGPGGNTILGNGGGTRIGAGVRVLSGSSARISTNSMSFNSGTSDAIAIDLGNDGATPNSPCNFNGLENSPVLEAAEVWNGTTIVSGKLNAGFGPHVIEFFSSAPGTLNQGETFLGSATVWGVCSPVRPSFSEFSTPFTVVLPTVAIPPFSITAVTTGDGIWTRTSEMTAPILGVPALTATKSFTPASIHIGQTSTLRVTITNSGPGTVSALWVDDALPSGLVPAPGTPATTCGGVVSVAKGDYGGPWYFLLYNGSLGGGATCNVTLPVTSNVPAALLWRNTIAVGGITGSYLAPPPAPQTPSLTMNVTEVTATLSVALLPPPTVAKSFADSIIAVNRNTRMTITVGNSSTAAMNGLKFTDTLPAGLTIAASANAANTCGGTLSAALGSGSVALSGGTIPPGGSCTVAVDLTAGSLGTMTNTIAAGAVTSTNAQPNSSTASASLLVVRDIPAVTPLGLLALTALIAATGLLRLRR